jgi:hypothetical protein
LKPESEGTIFVKRSKPQQFISSPHDAATSMVARLEMNIQAVYTLETSRLLAACRVFPAIFARIYAVGLECPRGSAAPAGIE